MTIQDSFDFPIAYNPTTDELVTGATFTVYAVDDIALATPLAVTDPVSGAAITPLVSSSIGVLPSFAVAGDPAQVILKSGTFVTLLTSKYGIFLDVVPDPAAVVDVVETVTEGRLSAPELEATFVAWTNVFAHGAKADDTTDSRAAINAAILACSSSGGGVVVFPPGKYVVSGEITPRSNVTLWGPGAQIRSSVTGNIIYARATALTNFTVDALTFVGPVLAMPTVPTRVTAPGEDVIFDVPGATSGPGAVSAFAASGDTDPDSPGGARLENITIRNCKFLNLAGLPLLLKGVRGVLRVVDNDFLFNMDIGFVAYEELIFRGNHVYGSRDNGLSASRGGRKLVISGNTFENCAYNGIFVAGFSGSKGPTNGSVTGNTVIDVGNSGIYLDEASKNIVVNGNHLDGGYFRGPVDGPTNGAISGVFVGGFPSSNRAAPTDWAEGILVTGNMITRFPRAGVFVTGAKNCDVIDNRINSVGTQFLADGTTAISAADQTTNVGVLVDQATTSSGLVIALNQCVDTRTTPYMNWAIYPVGSSVADEYFNKMLNARNAYNLVETGPTRNINWGAIFQTNVKATAGITYGANAATGTVAGADINGADGSNRMHNVQTAGSNRWRFGGDGTAESSTQTGTNFQLRRHLNDGNYLDIPFEVTRQTGQVKLSIYPVKLFAAATGSRPTASAAGSGAHMFDTTLGKPIWSDGTNWRDATGATV